MYSFLKNEMISKPKFSKNEEKIENGVCKFCQQSGKDIHLYFGCL